MNDAQPPPHAPRPRSPEPRWPAVLAVLAAGAVYAALPEFLSVGPRWLLIVLVVILEIPTLIAHHAKNRRLYHLLGYSVSAILTLFLIWSLTLLIIYLPEHKETPIQLLRSAATLWTSNIIVFALWYWRLDAGGPIARSSANHHSRAAFLFPQMALPADTQLKNRFINWYPHFIDYLFLAFNTSTAFSPTDTPILNRWAKILVMLQSLLSLTILALLAARAVNIM